MAVLILLWRVDISLDRAFHHRETTQSQPVLQGSGRAREGTTNPGIVIWSSKKRENRLAEGGALAPGLSSHAGNLANISQRVPLCRTNRKCPWLRLAPGTDDPTLWRHSDRQMCLDRQCPVNQRSLYGLTSEG